MAADIASEAEHNKYGFDKGALSQLPSMDSLQVEGALSDPERRLRVSICFVGRLASKGSPI